VDLDGDFLSQATQLSAQLAIEFEAEQHNGAGLERSPPPAPTATSIGSGPGKPGSGRSHCVSPKLREGNFFPSLLEPRRRAEKALLAVVQTAYVQGVSTRQVDDLVRALGLSGIDQSKVSQMCSELDGFVQAFRNRPLEGSFPYLWLDALYLKVRQDHRIVRQALVVAIAVLDTGDREILGLALGQGEEYAFWLDFLRGLVRRGLKGVQLVISDAHEGLKAAEVVAAAEEDVLAYMAFPQEHRSRIYSTNPLERVNEEVKRRTNVVGLFPDEGSVVRLVGSVLLEIWDEWQIGRRYFSQESRRKLTEPKPLMVAEPQPLTLAPVR